MIFEPLVGCFAETMQGCMDEVAARAEPHARSAQATQGPEPDDVEIASFAARTRALTGKAVEERDPWNQVATRDAIRHFAYGTADDNPLWLDPEYAAAGVHGGLLAPPTFLISVLYPVLHGVPDGPPLSSLLRDIEFRWERRIREGDQLCGVTEQGDVELVPVRGSSPRVYLETHTTYRDANGDRVGSARSTVVRLRHRDGERVVERDAQRYRPEELARIIAGIDAEVRTGARVLRGDDVVVGHSLPPIVRGPLTIGDLVCWHAAIGPAYRAGPLGFKDTRATPGFVVVNPVTGWPVKFTHQHEDIHLTQQRGMPAPFDNGIMRLAWATPLLTNWMGDQGFLERLHLTIHAPVLYGDTNWYAGTVVAKTEEEAFTRVRVRVTGTNQLGAVTTAGDADVRLPRRAAPGEVAA
jgi:acyl dehydratase